jgi:hypothetical protein
MTKIVSLREEGFDPCIVFDSIGTMYYNDGYSIYAKPIDAAANLLVVGNVTGNGAATNGSGTNGNVSGVHDDELGSSARFGFITRLILDEVKNELFVVQTNLLADDNVHKCRVISLPPQSKVHLQVIGLQKQLRLKEVTNSTLPSLSTSIHQLLLFVSMSRPLRILIRSKPKGEVYWSVGRR